MQPQSRELSKKNPYYLPKNRQYELRYFCRQYNYWKYLEGLILSASDYEYSIVLPPTKKHGDPITDKAVMLADLKRNCEMVEKAAFDSDNYIHKYILISVTKGYSFSTMKAKYEIPCERDMFYDRCRKFYYILSQIRGI